MNSKALVTGPTGFVGSNLVRGLLRNGWQIDVIVRPSSSLTLLSDIKNKIRVYRFNGKMSNLLEIVTDSKPDVVFHIASLFLSEHKPGQIEPLIQSNILFGTQLLEAMSNSSIHSLVNTGTSWEHFENSEYSPVNLYAASKKAFTDILQYYVEARKIRAITLKLFDTYGPMDPRPKLFHLLEKAANSQEELNMSPGEQFIDLVYIEDVVNAYQIAAKRLMTRKVIQHEIYSVSSGEPIRLRDLVVIYENLTRNRLPIYWGGRGYREREMMAPWSHHHTLPEWSPKTSISEGILKIIQERKQIIDT